jgi:hypothetical protein
MACGLTLGSTPGGLHDAELRLQLRGVPAEALERLPHRLAVDAALARGGQVLDTRERSQAG